MLLSLHIENVAVIKSVDIDFKEGFIALTGQTGAGKSIIIDSIKLLMGAKCERDIIRHGEDFCLVSGLFGGFSDEALLAFEDSGISPDDEGCFFIQRKIFKDGKSQLKINGRSISLSILKSVALYLVNIHGQSDTHSLMDSKNHINILDTYAGNSTLLTEYKALYSEYNRIKAEIAGITEKESERLRILEMYEYQVKDIDSYNLHPGEEEELIDKKLKLKNSEKIAKSAGFVFKALKGSEKGSVYFLLDKSIGHLSSLSDVIPEFTAYSEKLRDFLYQIDDIAEEVYAATDGTDEDPTEKLNDIESRLDKISKLKRKYGYTVEDILAFRERAFNESEKLKNSETVLENLNKSLAKVYSDAVSIANRIYDRRVSFAAELDRAVLDTLEFLDMPKVVFFTSIKRNTSGGELVLNSLGCDEVEFYISANKGVEAKSLAKIASGGELARIMLSLKSVIADKDGVSTVVFDEIDAGVSGKTARKIGIKLLLLSKSAQIFCVTHSAQIASLADEHYLISKSDESGKTETFVELLDDEGRINEISRILGGIEITDAQREAALDMLKEREIYKNN